MELDRTTSILDEIVDDTRTNSFNNNQEYELLKDIYDEIKGKTNVEIVITGEKDYGSFKQAFRVKFVAGVMKEGATWSV